MRSLRFYVGTTNLKDENAKVVREMSQKATRAADLFGGMQWHGVR